MSERTYISPATHPDGGTAPRPRSSYSPAPALAGARLLLAGALAAGLGLGILAAAVLLLWVISPYPDGSPGAALHIAADLWLLAHGADLLRTGTVDGGQVPVALTPLLLAALPGWLLYRVLGGALAGRRRGPHSGAHSDPYGGAAVGSGAAGAAGWVAAGYLLVGAAAAAYASSGPLRVRPSTAALALPLFVAAVAVLAAVTRDDRPPLGDHPAVRRLLSGPRAGAAGGPWAAERLLSDALRAALAGTGVLLGGGALLFLAALARHADAAWHSFTQLTGAWSDHLALPLLLVALLPNAMVWGAAYALGPGFTVGTGSTVGPLGAGHPPRLPDFPLFAALPAEGPGTPLTWAVAAVPLAAGLVLGRHAARTAVPVRGERAQARSVRGTVAVAVAAACGCGLATALLTAVSGGALGTGRLARLGPGWWLCGAAALGWTVVVGVPAALVVRGWRLRSAVRVPTLTPPDAGTQRRPGKGSGKGARARGRAGHGPVEGWHTTAARRTRWAALKEASGGLMTDFAPRTPRDGDADRDGDGREEERLPEQPEPPEPPETPEQPETPEPPDGPGEPPEPSARD